MRAYKVSVEAIHLLAVVAALVLGGGMIKRSLHRDGPVVTQTWRGRSNAPDLGVSVFTLV